MNKKDVKKLFANYNKGGTTRGKKNVAKCNRSVLY